MKLSTLSEIDKKELLNEVNDMIISYRKKLNFNNKLTFGVELEYGDALRKDIMSVMEGISGEKGDSFYQYWQPRIDHEFTIVKDGKYYGGEIVSPIMKNKEKYFEQILLACNTLKEKGATTNNLMGCHVHVSREKLTSDLKKLETFLKMYMVYEDIIFKFGCYGSDLRKVANIYANPISKDLKEIFENNKNLSLEQLKEILEMFKKTSALCYSENAYTFEFRSCNATIDPIIVQNNINLFCSLIDSCSKKKIDTELLDYKIKKDKKKNDLDKAIEFADTIYKTDEDKKYFLKQYIM